jgi:predicted peptidase
MQPLFRIAAILAICWTAPVLRAERAQDALLSGFEARTFHGANGVQMPYRLFVPANYEKNSKYPLVLWLHGAAGRGNDNVQQISGGSELGSHIWTKPENQAKFPAFVLAPQCPNGQFWGRPRDNSPPPQLGIALKILDAIEKEFSIDLDRVYVAGQSMGGEGTWAAIRYAPGRFAAAVPLCGYLDLEEAPSVVDVPVWIFQGEADPIVSVTTAREFVAALKKAFGTARYSEYPGVGHNVWERAFAEPELATWLAKQTRQKHVAAN